MPETVRSFLVRPNRLLARTVEYTAHTAVFFIGTQFALVCLEAVTRRRRVAIIAAAAITAVAAEAAQTWVPTRGVDVFDAVCNLIGVGLAAVAYVKLFAPFTARGSASA
ncbi:VanZ family protein [Caulifigura coniformis]|uniref:VanZ family protein n=1 Tax=Caulifigura coniformis TaxID=2527983 RepID=UPI0018D25BEF|nr:VanZ family protein [Caulifigura coniformis]